jgi:hypothetical protein
MRLPADRGRVAWLAVAIALGGCSFGQASGTPQPSTAASAASRTAPASPSSVASPAQSASPSGGALKPGTYARVSADGLRIRVKAKATATPIGALFFSDVVRIRADGGVADGFHWYEIETIQTTNDLQLTGFVAGAKGDEAYLEAMPGPPSPTPPRSPSPSEVPSSTP